MKKTVSEWCPNCQRTTSQCVYKQFGEHKTTRYCLDCNITLETIYDKGINPVSDRQSKINAEWRKVSALRFVDVGGRCEICGLKGDWRNLSAHHKIKRRFNVNTYENCQILCGRCHSKQEGIKEV